jgi:hypothetical protein
MSKSKTNAVALNVPSVMDGIEVLNTKIESLKHIQESVYKTTGKIGGFNNNIKDEMNIAELIKMGSSVQAREDHYNSYAMKALKLKTFPVFKLDGHTLEEITADITLRIAILENKERLDNLNELKKEYTELMDKEDRKAILAAKLAQL